MSEATNAGNWTERHLIAAYDRHLHCERVLGRCATERGCRHWTRRNRRYMRLVTYLYRRAAR